MRKNFRAFDKKSKQYIEDFLIEKNGDVCFALTDINGEFSLLKFDAVLEEWTGLTDCYGTKIFENDIIKSIKNCFTKEGCQIRQVCFLNGKFCVDNVDLDTVNRHFEAVVIGNCNLNPELLEAKK